MSGVIIISQRLVLKLLTIATDSLIDNPSFIECKRIVCPELTLTSKVSVLLKKTI